MRTAVEDGTLAADRLESWRRLGRELAHLERRSDQAAAAAERDRVRALRRAHLRRKSR